MVELFKLYGDKCVCCGQTEESFLVLDHIDNDGSKHRRMVRKNHRAGGISYAQILKDGYKPEKYQILCSDCKNYCFTTAECL